MKSIIFAIVRHAAQIYRIRYLESMSKAKKVTNACYGPVKVIIDESKFDQFCEISYQGAGRPTDKQTFQTFENAKEQLENILKKEDFDAIYQQKRKQPDVEQNDTKTETSDTTDEENDELDQNESHTQYENRIIQKIISNCSKLNRAPFSSKTDIKLLEFYHVYRHSFDDHLCIIRSEQDLLGNFRYCGAFLVLQDSFAEFVKDNLSMYETTVTNETAFKILPKNIIKHLMNPAFSKINVKKIFIQQFSNSLLNED